MSVRGRTTEAAEIPGSSYQGEVRIPGYGQPPNRCRSYDPVGACSEGHVLLGRPNCGTRYCPDHWRDWAAGATAQIVQRCAAYREVAEGAGKRLLHVTVSPPQDWYYSEERLYDARSRAYEVAAEAGVRGGVCIAHPYRVSERGERLWEAANDSGEVEEGTGKWRFLRDLSDGWAELEGYVSPEPHYHFLAAAEDLDTDAVRDGWVVKRIRSFSRFHRWDTESYRDMARTAYYTLTHGAVASDRATVTYFGEMHPSVFDPEGDLPAAAADKIEAKAEAAGGPEREGPLPEGCEREGCEGEVFGIEELGERLSDDDWVLSVRSRPGGRARWLRLRGAWEWYSGKTDRPPPHVATDEQELREWLETRGRVITPGRTQGRLSVDV